MMEVDETPAYLCWLDLETSGLSPEKDVILELSFVLTRFVYPYELVCQSTFLVKHDLTALERRLADNPFVYKMHKKSMLLDDFLNRQEEARTLAEVEADLLELSKDWPPPVDEDPGVLASKVMWEIAAQAEIRNLGDAEEAYRTARMRATDKLVVLAGSSVHFDKSFLKVHMPTFHKCLSHRIFDASAMSLVCRSMGMPRLPKLEEGRSHRAEYDVMQSIEQVRAGVRWLAAKATRGELDGW